MAARGTVLQPGVTMFATTTGGLFDVKHDVVLIKISYEATLLDNQIDL